MKPLETDRFYIGDCVEALGGFPDGSIDLTVTSPPYDELRDYRGYRFDAEGVARELLRVTKESGVVVWVVGDRYRGGRSMTSFRQAVMFQDIGFVVHDVMIYQKKSPGNACGMRSGRWGCSGRRRETLPDGCLRELPMDGQNGRGPWILLFPPVHIMEVMRPTRGKRSQSARPAPGSRINPPVGYPHSNTM